MNIEQEKFYGKAPCKITVDIVRPEGRKLRGTWTSYIKPSLWHWNIYVGYFKVKWYHYLLPPWFPPRD